MPRDPKQAAGEVSELDNFLKAVVKSSLLDAAQMQAARDAAPPEARNDAKALADHLVKSGKLTRFQAGKLLKGISLGLVFGPFHILSPLGRGGMGSVFLARDSRNQLLVAVKVLPPKQAKAKERLLVRFRREMEICRRVAHPNVTRTLEVGEQLGINFIAMEFIPGKDLYHLVRDRGPLTVERTARLFSEVAAGLEHAHTMGLIHRDMKPSNIMIMPDDHAKILDLGLALIAGDREPTVLARGQGVLIGTPDYMAPEQGEDPLKVDTRSDIYGVGCTIYYALSGQVPFPGGGALQKMLRHKCDPPVPISKLNPKVPTSFAGLLSQMMAKQPDQRFQSAAEVRDALLKWCGEPGKTDNDGQARPAGRPPEAAAIVLPIATAAEPPPLAVAVPAAPLAKPVPQPTPAQPVSPPSKPPAPIAAGPPPAAAAKPSAPAPAVAALASPAPASPPANAVSAKPAEANKPQFPPPVPEPRPARPAVSPPPAAPKPFSDKLPGPLDNGASAVEATPLPSGEATVTEPAGLPFFIDFIIPVAIGSLFLLTLWILGLVLLLRSGG